jgi:hypothetical protein
LARVFMASSAVSFAATRLGMGGACWPAYMVACKSGLSGEDESPRCQRLPPRCQRLPAIGAVGALQPTLTWSLIHPVCSCLQTAGRKPRMEDRHVTAALHPQHGVADGQGAVTPQQAVSLAAVFDGHAGDATASYAARHIPQLLHSALSGQHNVSGKRSHLARTVWWPAAQLVLNLGVEV